MSNPPLKENSLIQNSHDTSNTSTSKYLTPNNRSPNTSFALQDSSRYSINLGNRKSEYKIDPGKTLSEAQFKVVLLAAEVERLGEINIKLVKENEIFRATNEKSQREKDLEFKLALVLAENEKLNEVVEHLNQTPDQLNAEVERESVTLRSHLGSVERRYGAVEEELKQIIAERDRLKAERRMIDDQFNQMRLKMNEVIGQNYMLNQEKLKLIHAIQDLEEARHQLAQQVQAQQQLTRTPKQSGSFHGDMTMPEEEERVKRSGLGSSSEEKAKLRTLAEEIAKYRKQVSDLEKDNLALKAQLEGNNENSEKAKQLEEANRALEESNKGLLSKIQSLDDANRALQNKLQSLDEIYRGQQGKMQSLDETNRGLQNKVQELQKNIDQLSPTLQHAEHLSYRVLELERENVTLKSTIEIMKEGIDNARRGLEQAAEDSKRSEEQAKQMEVLLSNNENLNTVAAKLSQDLDNLRFKNAQLQAQLLEKKGVESQLSEAKTKIATLNEQIEEQKNKISGLEDENKFIIVLRAQIETLTHEKLALNDRITELENQSKVLILEIDSLSKERESLKRRISELESQNKLIDGLQNQIQNLSQEVIVSESKISTLELENKKIEEMRGHLQILLGESRQLKETLFENADLKKKLEKSTSDFRNVETEKSHLLDSVSSKNREIEALNLKLSELTQNVSNTSFEIDSQSKKIEDLQALLQERERTSELHRAAASDNASLLEKSRAKVEVLLAELEDLKQKLQDAEQSRDSFSALASSQQSQLQEDLQRLNALRESLKETQEKLSKSEEEKASQAQLAHQNAILAQETAEQLAQSQEKVSELTKNFEVVQVKLGEIERNFNIQREQRSQRDQSERQESMYQSAISTHTQYFEIQSEPDEQPIERLLKTSVIISNEKIELQNLLRAKDHQLSDQDAKIFELSKEITELKLKLSENEKAFAESQQSMLDALSTEIKQLNDQIAELKRELDLKSQLASEKQAELEETLSKLESLKAELESSRGPRHSSQPTEDDISQARSIPIQDLISDYEKSAAAELEELKSKLQAANNDIVFLQKLVAQKEAEIETLKKQVIDLGVENSLIPGLELRNKTVHEELQKALKDIEDLKTDNQKQRRRSVDYASSTLEVDKYKQQVQILLEENSKLNNNLEKQHEDLEQLRTKLLEAERNSLLVDPLNEKINKLISDLAHKNNELEALRKRLDETEPKEIEADNLRRQLNAQISDNARLFEENQSLKSDIDTFKATAFDPVYMNEEKKQLNAKVVALAEEVTTLNDVLTNELYEKEKTRAIIENIALECETYKKKIAELTSENEKLASNFQAALEDSEKGFVRSPRPEPALIEQLNSKIKFLTVDIAAQNNIIDGLKRKCDENQKLVDEAEANKHALTILNKEKDNLSRLLHEKMKEVEGLKGQVLEHARGNTTVEQLQNKCKMYSEEVQKLNELLLRKARESESLYEEIRRAKSAVGEVETLRLVNNMLSEENMKLRSANAEIMSDVNVLKKRIGDTSIKPTNSVSPLSDRLKAMLSPGYSEKKNY